jgi:hypothetical protein
MATKARVVAALAGFVVFASKSPAGSLQLKHLSADAITSFATFN